MLKVGDRIPSKVKVWLSPREQVTLGERGKDDLETPARLPVRVERRVAAVRHHRRGAGDDDAVADANRARVADDGLVRRSGGDESALHGDP